MRSHRGTLGHIRGAMVEHKGLQEDLYSDCPI